MGKQQLPKYLVTVAMTTCPLRFLQRTQQTKPPFRELKLLFSKPCLFATGLKLYMCVTLYVEEQEKCVKVWAQLLDQIRPLPPPPASWRPPHDPGTRPRPTIETRSPSRNSISLKGSSGRGEAVNFLWSFLLH